MFHLPVWSSTCAGFFVFDMQEKTYTESELISFGNYMLNQDKRKRKEQVRTSVTHADIENWKVKG